MRTSRSVLLGTLLLAACSGGKKAATGPAPAGDALHLESLVTAEAAYSKVEVDGAHLRYTFFDDADGKCAQWVQQTPCWTSQDLQTVDVELTQAQLDELRGLVDGGGFLALDATYPATLGDKENWGYSGMDPGQRYYAYTVTARLGDQEHTVTYQSYPDAEPPPTAFAALRDKLDALAADAKAGADTAERE